MWSKEPAGNFAVRQTKNEKRKHFVSKKQTNVMKTVLKNRLDTEGGFDSCQCSFILKYNDKSMCQDSTDIRQMAIVNKVVSFKDDTGESSGHVFRRETVQTVLMGPC